MPFKVKVITTIEHVGPADESTFKIHLNDGTVLIGTSCVPRRANCSLRLHPDRLPSYMQTLIEEEYQHRLMQEYMYAKDIDVSGRDPVVLAKNRTRERLSALIAEVIVGQPLVITIGVQSISMAAIVRLEGSA